MSAVKLVAMLGFGHLLATIDFDPAVPESEASLYPPGTIRMTNPVSVQLMQKQDPNDPNNVINNLHLEPFFTFSENESVLVPPSQVQFMGDPISTLLNQYNRIFGTASGIQVVGAGALPPQGARPNRNLILG